MKYSGNGNTQSKEKADRKDYYNPIGGHIEAGEDVIECARKEAMEEAGITLLRPKIKGIVNGSGFGGKNVMNFIVTATTEDEPLASSIEGELHWVKNDEIEGLRVFADIRPMLDTLQIMKDHEMFVGKVTFDAYELKSLELTVI